MELSFSSGHIAALGGNQGAGGRWPAQGHTDIEQQHRDSNWDLESWSGVSFLCYSLSGQGAVGNEEAWLRPDSPGCWLPASLSAEAEPSGSPWLASRKLQILGYGPGRKERDFCMLLIVPMTIQEQSKASRCLLPPASAQLFWPHSPISLACLWEHWAFVSFQNHSCVPRALCLLGRANRATSLLANPQYHHPVKSNPWSMIFN